MSLSVSVLIPTFNDWSKAVRCARSVVEHSGYAVESALIVDDCSDDLQPNSLPEQIRVVRNAKNRGVIATENKGVSRLDADIVVILDSDAEPLMDFVPAVREAFERNPRLAVLAFHTVDREGNPTGSVSPEPSLSHFLLGQRTGSWIRQKKWWGSELEKASVYAHSCATAYRREVFETLEGFDEQFSFLDYDIDYSIRVQRAGWEVSKSDEIVVYHEDESDPKYTSGRVVRYHQNRWRLLQKHGKIGNSLLIKFLLALRHVMEYGSLRVMGSILTSTPEEQKDKLSGRRVLLRRVWSEYQS